MRNTDYWEDWLKRNAGSFRKQVENVRDWYRVAGVSKGERRSFRAALKRVGEGFGRKSGKGKFTRHRPTEGPAPDGASSRKGRASAGGPVREGRLRFTREGRPQVITDSPEEPAIRIPGHALSGALPKDRVLVRMERRRGGAPPYGKILKIVERGIRTFVGRYAPFGNGHFVRFRDRESDLRLEVEHPGSHPPDAGDLVLAEITEYPRGEREGRARIVRTLGKSHTMETIVLSVVSARDLPAEFSDGAARDASSIPSAVRAAGNEKDGKLERVDLRDLPFVTIDGEDARDFDDAVCLVENRGGLRLLVAIADVSHYVTPGSETDREAYGRGTSVYFPDRCIPMLPPALSEGVCSLKPGVNRLTVTAEIPLDAKGHRTGPPVFYPSLIRSHARLTYAQVHEFLARNEGTPDGGEGSRITPSIGCMLRNMQALAGVLTLARADRGALDFDLPESKVEVSDGMPESVRTVSRWESHRLIEEFMLLANTAVAEFLSDRGHPFLFRIHEPPAEDRLEEFEAAASRLLRRSRVTERRDIPGRLQAWAGAARGGKYEKHVNVLLLRSLMLARYGPETRGHFGLALARYTHFTSPIRRYPDLIVHRALKAALGEKSLDPYLGMLGEKGEAMGAHLSGRERVAMEAERDVEQRAKALFMSARIGETLRGVIVSVVSFGLFVELEDFPVEGLIHVSSLRDDEYRFSADRWEWYGVVRRVRLTLGDRLVVRVRRADVERGEIDLQLVEKLPESF